MQREHSSRAAHDHGSTRRGWYLNTKPCIAAWFVKESRHEFAIKAAAVCALLALGLGGAGAYAVFRLAQANPPVEDSAQPTQPVQAAPGAAAGEAPVAEPVPSA